MAEVLARYERTRWAVESAHGTAGTASYRLFTDLSLMLDADGETDEFTPAGLAVPTVVSSDKELTKATLTGRFGFNSVPYPLSAAYGTAVIGTPSGGTVSREWVWTPAVDSEIDPVSFTWEQGQAAYAVRATYGTLAGFGFSWGRGPIEVSGDGFAQALATGISLTSASLGTVSPTVLAYGKNVNVYLDDPGGTVGTTLLTRAISGEWQFGTGRAPAFYVNQTAQDFAHTADGDPPRDVSLVMQANSAGMALLTNWRNGTNKLMRVELIGGTIEGTIRYRAYFDCALLFKGVPSRSEQDRVFGVTHDMGITFDETWQKAVQITVINKLTSL